MANDADKAKGASGRRGTRKAAAKKRVTKSGSPAKKSATRRSTPSGKKTTRRETSRAARTPAADSPTPAPSSPRERAGRPVFADKADSELTDRIMQHTEEAASTPAPEPDTTPDTPESDTRDDTRAPRGSTTGWLRGALVFAGAVAGLLLFLAIGRKPSARKRRR